MSESLSEEVWGAIVTDVTQYTSVVEMVDALREEVVHLEERRGAALAEIDRLQRERVALRDARAQAAEALRALYDLAPKCDVCEVRLATRGDDDTRLCDRDECNTVDTCASCNSSEAYGAAGDLRCVLCGAAGAKRGPVVAAPVDLPHAEALRAANAHHEANR